MLLKCTVLFLVIVAVRAATLQGRNIPVEIRYEKLDHDVSSNLDEKVQLSQEEIKENNLRLQKVSAAEEDVEPTGDHNKFINNFDEKVQLSPEDLLQSTKHLPFQNSIQEDGESLSQETLEDLRDNSQSNAVSGKEAEKTFIHQAQIIVENGLKNLRNNFKQDENQKFPPKELWDKLENEIKNYFTQENNKLDSRQNQGATPTNPTNNQQNFVQNFIQGFQQITNNFLQQGGNSPNGTSGDEGQQQGPFQGYFAGVMQNIVTNIQSIAQSGQQQSPPSSTVLGDSGSQAGPGNFIGGIISNVQNFFGGGQNTAVNGIQGSEDEATTKPPNFLQQIAHNIGNTIQSIQNQYRPQGSGSSTVKPVDGSTSSYNPIEQAANAIGSQIQSQISGSTATYPIQNLIPGTSSQKPQEGGSNSNPIGEAANTIGNQIQSQISGSAGNYPVENLIPGSSNKPTSSSEYKPVEEQLSEKIAAESSQQSEEKEKKDEVLAAVE